MSKSLEQRFTARMFEIYKNAKEQANYTASIFYDMITRNGGLLTAKTLISALKPSVGYTALYERNRLDLTVEAVVIEEPEWRELFTDDEIKKASERLKKYGYSAQKR
ncbi:hypothetical protein GCM10010909_29900 [Acidocella aquatica]|uniref:Uncharacterized protein n=1 Tax=Acidocella aquatica TaxID=1922313 RepID=A0ABQ6ADX3_9PROT|nr:hypothetical protein [Acidocella aquatica]GLR68309.1 hypothetical protein GCM10010909_29900 [Acidocella aquatica]